MSQRGKPQFGCDGVFVVPSPEFYLRISPIAAKWAAAGKQQALEIELQQVARYHECSARQRALAPTRADVNAMLDVVVGILRDFGRDWPKVRDANLVGSMRPMPCGPGDTYAAWHWFIEATENIARAARWRARRWTDLSRYKRKNYLTLSVSARALSETLFSIDFVSEKAILNHMLLDLDGRSGLVPSVERFTALMLKAAKAALRKSKKLKRRDTDYAIRVATHALAGCYVRFVGGRFTHTAHVGLDDYY
jgi:hypothetical protein